MPSIDDVIVRKATAEDRDAIVGNGDVYGGIDYLPDIFSLVVSDPEVYPVVAELKGQVVGFMMDHVIDGGKSVIRRAVRTFPLYRNLGIMHKMDKELTSLTEERFPKLRYRYQCRSIRGENTERILQLKGFVEILRKPLVNVVYTIQELEGIDTGNELPSVLALEYDDVKTLFTLDDLLEYMFPLKILFNFFNGYRCLESNIKHVLNENKEVCVTTKSTSLTPNTTMLTLLKDIDMVTFSYRYMAEAGLVYVIDMYAKEGHNEASLQAHIQRHLKVLKELNLCDRGVLVVSVGRNLCEETVRAHLRRFNFVDPLPNAERCKILFTKKP